MILVTGATGNVGRELVAQLHGADVSVRACSRKPIEGLPSSIDTALVDFDDPASFRPALDGVDAVYLMGNAENMATQVGAFADAAKQAGVRHIAFLSSASVEHRSESGITAVHRAAEEGVLASGVPWTLLRPGPFHSNFLWWAAQPVAAGERVVRHPFGNEPAAPIDAADVAAVAAVALTSEGHAGKAYLLTGGEQLTPEQQLKTLAEVLERELVFEEMSYEQAFDFYAPFFSDSDDATVKEMLDELLEVDLPWRDPVSTVETVTGRPPRRFRDWAVKNRSLFA